MHLLPRRHVAVTSRDPFLAAAPTRAPFLAAAAACLAFLSATGDAHAEGAYTKPAYTTQTCVLDPQEASGRRCRDIFHPAFPNTGQCTYYFNQFHRGFPVGDSVDSCVGYMGITKHCEDLGMHWGTRENPDGTIDLICRPPYDHDDFGEQFVHIWTGIGQGLITAAPFIGEAVAAAACLYGQIYACAILALNVSTQAGVEVPGEVGEVITIIAQAPQCAQGDVVSCVKLGYHGAAVVGLDIPGLDKVLLAEDAGKCVDQDFAACMRLGQAASDAGGVGINVGKLVGTVANSGDCLDGKSQACIELGKEAAQAGVPLGGIPEGIETAQACRGGSTQDCIRLGREVSSAASGLVEAAPAITSFGANACISAAPKTGTVDLASIWNDYSATSVAVFPGDGAKFTRSHRASHRAGGWADTGKHAAADFNGDGLTDILTAWDDAGRSTLTVRQASAHGFDAVHWASRAGAWYNDTIWLPGDFNGDKRIDIAAVWRDRGLTSISVFLSDGRGFRAPATWNERQDGWSASAKWAVGDFDGDGRTDIAAAWDDAGSTTLTVRRSTGTTFAASHWSIRSGGWSPTAVWLAGDFNGDGKLDLAAPWRDGDATSIAMFASDGARFTAPVQWSLRDGGWNDRVNWTAADFNGDGKADLAAAWDDGGSNTLTVRRSTGTAFAPAHWATKASSWNASASWCAGHFPRSITTDTFNARVGAGRAALVRDLKPPVALGRVKLTGLASPAPSICEAARSARARNSPAAPGLERQCAAAGASAALPPLDPATVDALAGAGAAIASADPAVAQARGAEAGASYRRGFDIGSGLFGDPALGAKGNTLMGPGSARIRDSLDPAGQRGFTASVAFHLARDYAH